jgi:hypothetical protein
VYNKTRKLLAKSFYMETKLLGHQTLADEIRALEMSISYLEYLIERLTKTIGGV